MIRIIHVTEFVTIRTYMSTTSPPVSITLLSMSMNPLSFLLNSSTPCEKDIRGINGQELYHLKNSTKETLEENSLCFSLLLCKAGKTIVLTSWTCKKYCKWGHFQMELELLSQKNCLANFIPQMFVMLNLGKITYELVLKQHCIPNNCLQI